MKVREVHCLIVARLVRANAWIRRDPRRKTTIQAIQHYVAMPYACVIEYYVILPCACAIKTRGAGRDFVWAARVDHSAFAVSPEALSCSQVTKALSTSFGVLLTVALCMTLQEVTAPEMGSTARTSEVGVFVVECMPVQVLTSCK